MIKYFEVVAKCGHVGRNQYYEGHFPVIAANKKQAARKIKRASRVKKNHEDAILSVNEIDEQAYLILLAEYDTNPYFHCNSSHKQNFDDIKESLRPETDVQLKYRKQSKYYKDKLKNSKPSKYRGLRNPYKYNKLNRHSKNDTNFFLSDYNFDS